MPCVILVIMPVQLGASYTDDRPGHQIPILAWPAQVKLGTTVMVAHKNAQSTIAKAKGQASAVLQATAVPLHTLGPIPGPNVVAP